MSLPILLNFSQTGNMLSLVFANIVALRQEVTINLHQITIEEDNTHFQLQQIVPNINIIVGSIQQIVLLKQRNLQIFQFLHIVDN